MRAPEKIGLFGGTFNPIHNGHLRVAADVADKLLLPSVIFIPSGRPPHKNLADNVSGEHRLRMTRLAVAADTRFAASDIEVLRGGDSFTLDTLTQLKTLHPGSRFVFLIGADAWRDIAAWRRPAEALPLTDWAVMRRPGHALPSLREPLGGLASDFETLTDGGLRHRTTGIEVFYADIPLCDISSTEIRDDIKQGRSLAGKAPSAVDEYIRKNHLYAETYDTVDRP